MAGHGNPLPTRDAVTGVVLAGGEGRRMGGADKGLVAFEGEPLVSHVLRRLAPQVATLRVSANRNLERYRAFGHDVVADGGTGHAGPLAGIAAGLAAATTPWVLFVPCDVPRLPLDLRARLGAAAVQQGAVLACARTGEGLQPTHALVLRELGEDLARFLSAGGRRVADWYARHDALAVDFDDEAGAFANVNTRAELDALAGGGRDGGGAMTD